MAKRRRRKAKVCVRTKKRVVCGTLVKGGKKRRRKSRRKSRR